MYAVIQTGGKQYRVAKGERVKIEKLAVEEGASVNFDQVLLVGEGDAVKFGNPLLNGANVTATVVKQGRYDKIKIFKLKRRKHHLKRQGHVQDFTEVEVTGIQG